MVRRRSTCALPWSGFLSSDCVQLVYEKAGLKGLKLDLSNAESTTDS